MNSPTTRKVLVGLVLAATATLTLGASPASADEKPAADYCWQNLDNGRTQCFVDAEALDEAIVSQTNTVLASPGAAARVTDSSAASVTYTIATWYEDTNYLGAFTKTTTTNSSICTGVGLVNGTFTSAWNDRVSSFKTWFGCQGMIYQNAGQSGASYGLSTAAPSIGALNDEGTSYRLV